MITILSLVTSIKDYVEIVHKVVETNSINGITTYYDLGATVTFSALIFKEALFNFLSLKWLGDIWSIPTLIPDIASSMISEISISKIFNDNFTLLEKPLSYGNQNLLIYCLEKFIIGVLNSIFLCFATSTSSLITLRRFVMQGLEAGSIAGLGSIFGNLVWLGSIIFGFRFIVIPWLSLDILRYILGFILLVKYMWDSYSERRSVLTDLSKTKIFLLNFLLAFTEQTSIFPFLNNLSIGSDSTILETFPALSNNQFEFFLIHGCYLLGILLGSLSLLQFTCWFWENPAYNLYMWTISSFRGVLQTSFTPEGTKFLNFVFLYLTMICTINSIGYFGLDYTLTNPLGFVHEDRLIEQKVLLETSFLNSKASDRNTRRNRGRHGRRERWKRRVRSYRTFDASLYDQGVYDLFPIEDLNYGFDRFWLRRKIRNHRVRFRFFPGPWMRSLKKQFARPRLESFMGPRVEFFRILFEQAYSPEFHEFKPSFTSSFSYRENPQIKVEREKTNNNEMAQSYTGIETPKNLNRTKDLLLQNLKISPIFSLNSPLQKGGSNRSKTTSGMYGADQLNLYSLSQNRISYNKKDYYSNIGPNSFLRKFTRKVDNRLKVQQVQNLTEPNSLYFNQKLHSADLKTLPPASVIGEAINNQRKNSKQWVEENFFQNFYKNLFKKDFLSSHTEKNFSKSDQFITEYKSFLKTNNQNNMNRSNMAKLTPLTLLHPLKFYIQKDEAFRKKCKFYGVKQFRSYNVENNAPYFRVMMKRFFYYYKPTLRWERTMRVATMRKARRKASRTPRKWNVNLEISTLANLPQLPQNKEGSPPYQKVTEGYLEDNRMEKEGMHLHMHAVQVQAHANKTFALPPLQRQSLASGRASTVEKNSSNIQKPTDFYSLVSKKASRYRYQIYKDVLQHWYYSKMNRLLLKFDIDSFIRRQPKNHFLTKNEETTLHVKRFLLFEYFNSLRWYNYMQHYNTMKTTIGKTKSLANRAYNQQFFGTFKKIRHLFAISPVCAPRTQTVLKFDQPLYNEFNNTSVKSVVAESILHEELQQQNNSIKFLESINLENLADYNQSADLSTLLRLHMHAVQVQAQPPSGCTTCSSVNTEKSLLQNSGWFDSVSASNQTMDREKNFTKSNNLTQNLWFTLLKKCQNKLYDQKALKNFVLSKVEKNEKLTYNKEKQLKIRLEKLKDWSSVARSALPSTTDIARKGLHLKENVGSKDPTIQKNALNTSDFPSTIQKAMKEALYTALPQSQEKAGVNKKMLVIRKNKKRIFKKSITKNTLDNFNKIVLNTKENLKKKILNSNSFKFDRLFPYTLYNRKSTVFHFLFRKNRKTSTKKNLEIWRQTEKVFSKRKKIRKTFKRLKNVQNFILTSNPPPGDKAINRSDSTGATNAGRQESVRNKLTFFNKKTLAFETRKKLDTYDDFNHPLSIIPTSGEKTIGKNIKNWQLYQKNVSKKDDSWKKRRSRIRRYRFFKGRGPIKKRTLGEKLKGKFRFFKKYGSSLQQKKDLLTNKTEQSSLEFSLDKNLLKTYNAIFQTITKNSDSLVPEKNLFEMRPLKQSRTLVKKHRYWKKHKKPVFAQNKRKLRKRRRYLKAKIRVLTKKFKKIEFQSFIKKWWIRYQNQALNSEVSQILKDQNLDFSPTNFDHMSATALPYPYGTLGSKLSGTTQGNSDVVSQLMRSILTPDWSRKRSHLFLALEPQTNLLTNESFNNKPMAGVQKSSIFENLYLNNLNNTPFYAGWDESSRKFVVTNRLLSRKNTGYSYFNQTKKEEFTSGFFNSMNAATTLYWQIPFTTYDPDQFFALGMDGFSPIGWKNFTFKSVAQRTTKPILVQKMSTLPSLSSTFNPKKFSENVQIKVLNNQFSNITKSPENQNSYAQRTTNKFNQINQYRRIQKRYKRVKKHPRPPVWFPSGALSSQILPVHYIYVFYKRYSLPRDRYVRRRLRVNKSQSFATATNNQLQYYNYTLRKRIKPKRKYHRKNFKFLRKNENLVQTIFRRQFREYSNEKIRFRPSSSIILKQSDIQSRKKIAVSSASPAEGKARKGGKNKLSNKSSRDNLRLRQLRRRVQRQVFRPVWRYKPQAGGFIWPGDYLRLDLIKAPKLGTLVPSNSSLIKDVGTSEKTTKQKQRKIRKKKRRMVPEWQIQPKKYLLQKHNIKVLKKRLEKSQTKVY